MDNRVRAALYQLSDPRKAALVISLVLMALALTGCGSNIPACPSGGTAGGGCSGG